MPPSDCECPEDVRVPPSLELVRATNYADYQSPNSLTLTSAWETLICDLAQPNDGLSNDKHWAIKWITFLGIMTGQAPAAAPISGLFACPKGTPKETLAQAQAGIFFDARQIPIPTDNPSMSAPLVPGQGNILQLAVVFDEPYIVPSGYFLRVIVSCAPGTAQPGPGPGSSGRLRAGAFGEWNAFSNPYAPRR